MIKIKIILIYTLIYSNFPFASNINNMDLWNLFSSAREYISQTTPNNFDRSLVNEGFWNFFSEIDDDSIFNFLSGLMELKSQRENWYEVSQYIAEFSCFSSNFAIISVGIYDRSWFTIFAGLMSAISHAIPTQFAHDLDRLGVVIVGLVVIYNLPAVMKSRSALYSGLLALTLNVADTVFSRKYGEIIGPCLHVAWHLSAAVSLHKLSDAIKDYSPTRIIKAKPWLF